MGESKQNDVDTRPKEKLLQRETALFCLSLVSILVFHQGRRKEYVLARQYGCSEEAQNLQLLHQYF